MKHSKNMAILATITAGALTLAASKGSGHLGFSQALEQAGHDGSGIKKFKSAVDRFAISMVRTKSTDILDDNKKELVKSFSELDLAQLEEDGLSRKNKEGFSETWITKRYPKSKKQKWAVKTIHTKGKLTRPEQSLEFNFGLKTRPNKKTIVPDEESFSLGINGELAVEEIDHNFLLEAMAGMAAVASPENIAVMPKSKPKYIRARGAISSRVAGDLERSFPKFVAYLSKYTDLSLKVRFLGERKKGKKGLINPASKMDGVMKIDLDALDEDHPDLADFVDRIATRVQLQFKIMNPSKQQLMSMRLKNIKGKPTMFISAVTKDGKIIPTSNKGKTLHLAGAEDFTKPGKRVFLGQSEFKLEWAGITMKSGVVEFKNAFNIQKSKATVDIKLAKLPSPEISGAFLNIIPMMDQKFDAAEESPEFVKVLTEGNDGKGMVLRGVSQASTTKAIGSVRIDASAEMVDNMMTKFMMGMTTSMLPSQEVSDDISKIAFRTARAMSKDLKSLGKSAPSHH